MWTRLLAALALPLLLASPAAAAPPGVPAQLSAAARSNLLEQATLASDAAARFDYFTAVAFTYPRLVKRMGGAAAAERLYEDPPNLRAREKTAIVGEVLGCAQVKAQLQCALDQVQRRETHEGTLRAQHDLLAFSDDRGANWTFAPADAPPDMVREALPEVSPLLPLRGEQEPVLEPRTGEAVAARGP